MDHEVYEAGDLALDSGQSLPQARLAFATQGELAADAANVVLLPSAFGGTHDDMAWLVGPGRAIDTDRYFVVLTNLFGAGLSSSPLSAGDERPDTTFPVVSIMDNVRAQRSLLTQRFGVERLHAVVGCSMGAIQALHWGAAFPDAVARLAAVCGTATTSTHCRVFLDSCRGAIELDPAWRDGTYVTPPERGLRHLGRIWAGWGFSQEYYRRGLFTELGFPAVEDFARDFWEAYFLARDANNLLCHIETWHNADISSAGGRTQAESLHRISAQTLLMPAETDMYFPPADIEAEAAGIPGASVVPIPGPYGHFSCSGAFPEQNELITEHVRALLT